MMKLTHKHIPLSALEANSGQIPGLPANPRLIKDDRYQKLRQSLQEDPHLLEARQLLVIAKGKKYVVFAGNMRLRVLNELAHETAPCVIVPPDTPLETLKRWTIKDNGSWGAHDWEALANEWGDLPLADWGVEMPSYADPDLDLNGFFEEQNGEPPTPRGGHKVILEYSPTEYAQVEEAFARFGQTRERVVFDLLGCSA